MDLRIGDTVANPTTGKTARVEKILHQKARLSDSTWHAMDALMPLQSIPNGLPPQKSPRLKADEYLEILSGMGYEFALNQMDDQVYVNGAMLSDVTAATIRSKMSDVGHTRFSIIEDAYTRAAQSKPFHPVTDYLSGLKWDGKNHIYELTGKFKDADCMMYFFFRRWLIGAVAKAYTGTQNPMLVLDGPQGMGKSEFTRWLCPVPDMHVEKPIHPDSNDDSIMLMSKWIWEAGELGSTTRRADKDALKHFLTIRRVTVRVPYAKHAISKPALASFIGTINSDGGGLLDDSTGNRRYLIVELQEIDWSYTSLDIDQVWAEAVAAYNAGENWRLDRDEGAQSDEIKERYVIRDPLEDWISKFFEIDPAHPEWEIPTTDIIDSLHIAGWRMSSGSKSESMAVAAALRSLGAVKPDNKITWNGAQVRGYKGVRRRLQQINNQPSEI